MIHHNENFIFKIMCLFVGRIFLVSHHGLRKPKHFYSLSPLGTMSDHNWYFTQGGIYPFLLILNTYFLYNFNQPCDSVGHCPIYQAHPIKHQKQCRFTNHALTPNPMLSPRASESQNPSWCTPTSTPLPLTAGVALSTSGI